MTERRETLLKHRARFGWMTDGLLAAARKLQSDYLEGESVRSIDGLAVMTGKEFTFVGEDNLHHSISILHDDPREIYRFELRRDKISHLDLHSKDIKTFTPETKDSFDLLAYETTSETIEKIAIDFVNSNNTQ